MMVALSLIVAALAGLCLLPSRYTGLLGLRIPGTPKMRRLYLGVMFFALVITCLYLKLIPVALILAIVGGAMIGLNKFHERMLDNDDLREDTRPGGHAGQQGWRSPARGAMEPAEAYAVLGLKPDAGPEDVEAAYKRLIASAHPDKGGTDYLAAKLNEARSVLKNRLQ